MTNGNEKSLATVVAELKQELSDFAQTRFQMLSAELKSKLALIKLAAPMFVLAAGLLLFGFVLFTGALVTVIAMAFDGTIGGWALAFVIVGGCYCIFGGISGAFAYKELKTQGLAPKRTMKVLKQDQVWLANEARSQL